MTGGPAAARAALSLLLFAAPSAVGAQSRAANPVDAVAARLGLESTRGIDFDICYPANAAEYEALGKNAIIQVTASSAIATELPLRTAYLVTRGVRVALQRVGGGDVREEDGRAVQVSYYLLPIHLMKTDARVLVDFRGARTGFGVTDFSARSSPDAMPRFARLDEYDQPGDPDLAVVSTVIAREYP